MMTLAEVAAVYNVLNQDPCPCLLLVSQDEVFDDDNYDGPDMTYYL